jgi:hypothetical protein
MNATEFLARAGQTGVNVALDDGALTVDGPQEAVDRCLPAIKAHKAELVAALQELVRLVGLVADAHQFTAKERTEALSVALADPGPALECFRLLAKELVPVPVADHFLTADVYLKTRRLRQAMSNA